jgi:hypothetical protein
VHLYGSLSQEQNARFNGCEAKVARTTVPRPPSGQASSWVNATAAPGNLPIDRTSSSADRRPRACDRSFRVILLLKQLGNPVSEEADPGRSYNQGNGEASERQDAVEHCLHSTDPCLPTAPLRWRLVHMWQSPGTLSALWPEPAAPTVICNTFSAVGPPPSRLSRRPAGCEKARFARASRPILPPARPTAPLTRRCGAAPSACAGRQ